MVGAPEGGDAVEPPTPQEVSQARQRLHKVRGEFEEIKRGAPAGVAAGAPVAAIGPLWSQIIATIVIKAIDALIKRLGDDVLTASRRTTAAKSAETPPAEPNDGDE